GGDGGGRLGGGGVGLVVVEADQDLAGRSTSGGEGGEGLVRLLGADDAADQRCGLLGVLADPGGRVGEVLGGVGEGAVDRALLGADGEGGELQPRRAHAH